MQEVLYLEIPTPATQTVCDWLHNDFEVSPLQKIKTPSGLRLQEPSQGSANAAAELACFIWSLQRTTYLKVCRWTERAIAQERQLLVNLAQGLQTTFPQQYPVPPAIDLGQESIFTALEPYYPQTVHYFRKFPRGEFDLTRVYWWEQRWRQQVQQPQEPATVVRSHTIARPKNLTKPETLDYDLIYIGGALGSIHAAVMANLGYRILLIERLPFGRMNREWNISRSELQSLRHLNLFTAAELEQIIACEYVDGFHKFFDANNPEVAKAPLLQTPTVLNIAIDAERLLELCGEKIRAAGGAIWDCTEFQHADIYTDAVVITVRQPDQTEFSQVSSRLLVDAMGTASPIAWQLSQKRTFDSVCPTVGALLEGIDPTVWDPDYGDVLNSHGDISRGRQLIWELFPAKGNKLTVYLFHYHEIHPDNPGSLLEMYEDFFAILPEYRRCDPEALTWHKPTFGYIPGHFSLSDRDRTVAFDRLLAVGDAASLQSPLIFTGFGSLVRNLPRLTRLLDYALQHDLLDADSLNQIRSYQSNVAVTWLFSKGMMVPTGRSIPPARINSMLNTFFKVLTYQKPAMAEAFMKDQASWIEFNRMALDAARMNPALLGWIWQLAGPRDMVRWLGNYLNFTWQFCLSVVLAALPRLVVKLQPWLARHLPRVGFQLLVWSYGLTDAVGQPHWQQESYGPNTPSSLISPSQPQDQVQSLD
ncbi:MAG: flavin-dependent dehydrogenase [Cyanobacteria bacterium P01_H01_bin.121]